MTVTRKPLDQLHNTFFQQNLHANWANELRVLEMDIAQFILSMWYICLILLKRGHWVFAWHRAQPRSRPGAQKCRGLDVLVGTAG